VKAPFIFPKFPRASLLAAADHPHLQIRPTRKLQMRYGFQQLAHGPFHDLDEDEEDNELGDNDRHGYVR